MKTKIAAILLLLIIYCGCSVPSYLPSSDNIGVNEFGAYIHLRSNLESIIDGELIAIDNKNIIVLCQKTKKCVPIKLSEVKKFSLRYAKPKNYGWTIPIVLILPAIHGFYSLLTLPINLITTISVTAGGYNAFKYTNKDLAYNKELAFERLKMFARFPNGIPPNIDLDSIK